MLYKAYVKPNSIVSTMTKQILLDSLLQEVIISYFESLFCVPNLSVWIQYQFEGSIILISIINSLQWIWYIRDNKLNGKNERNTYFPLKRINYHLCFIIFVQLWNIIRLVIVPRNEIVTSIVDLRLVLLFKV